MNWKATGNGGKKNAKIALLGAGNVFRRLLVENGLKVAKKPANHIIFFFDVFGARRASL